MNMVVLATIALGVCGLLAGWFSGVRDRPGKPGRKRVTPFGWVVLILIIALTAYVAIDAQRATAKFERYQRAHVAFYAWSASVDATIVNMDDQWNTLIAQIDGSVDMWPQPGWDAARIETSVALMRESLDVIINRFYASHVGIALQCDPAAESSLAADLQKYHDHLDRVGTTAESGGERIGRVVADIGAQLPEDLYRSKTLIMAIVREYLINETIAFADDPLGWRQPPPVR